MFSKDSGRNARNDSAASLQQNIGGKTDKVSYFLRWSAIVLGHTGDDRGISKSCYKALDKIDPSEIRMTRAHFLVAWGRSSSS